MNHRTDSDLLRDYARNGSESAFAEVVGRHIALVHSVALRVVVDAHLAEDVTQATFTVLAREARHLTDRTFLSSWLHRTASNQAANLVRGEMRRRAREQEAYAMQTLPPESDPAWKQIAPMLDDALNRLAEADRAVIFLRFFEKKTAADIASALKLSEEAAQKRVTRALERLRGLLAGGGAVLSTVTLTTLITTQAVVAAPIGLLTSVSAAALAGGTVAGGITITTLKLIIMSKLKVSAVSALLVAAIATPLVFQHQRVTKLRAENVVHAQQASDLRDENAKLTVQLANGKQREEISAAQLSELIRLRGEVGSLRRDSQESARLRARPQPQVERAATPPPDEAVKKFEEQRTMTVSALKQVGLQLRILQRNNNAQAVVTADGSLDSSLIARSHPSFDLKQVEMLVSEPSELRRLLKEAPETIIARTQPIATPDGKWLRVYSLADGSVHQRSTENANEAFDGKWKASQISR
ncbi:MAG TPA: sigma-70 family RNA polymerase sigma factor [Candidatus Acidoferrum sp.]|nr:sigma-70 family RNA polymerase sigma factor [Candidatus Acidoferrum sp.]